MLNSPRRLCHENFSLSTSHCYPKVHMALELKPWHQSGSTWLCFNEVCLLVKSPRPIMTSSLGPLEPYLKGETGRNTRSVVRIIILCSIAAAALASRLFSVIRFESIIHECRLKSISCSRSTLLGLYVPVLCISASTDMIHSRPLVQLSSNETP